MDRRVFLALAAAAAHGEEEKPAVIEFLCPMDPEVRSQEPGKCPRCGMRLEAGLPSPVEYRLQLETLPKALRTGQTAALRFSIYDPRTNRRVERFRPVHEKLFHLFLISEDLQYFAHEHPQIEPGGYFRFHTQFPLPGFYRLLGDFYPEGGTPQLLTTTLHVSGAALPVPSLQSPNLTIRRSSDPRIPVEGLRTMMFFELDPFQGVEPWLGAWGHLLSASADLLDLVHAHPVWEPQRNTVQFNLIFPRPGLYKLWAQFQRQGMVNTAAFEVKVAGLG